MLKDALKNYLDLYTNFWTAETGHPPRIDAEITQEPSACFFGDIDDEGYISWKYVKQPNPIDFSRLEEKHQIRVCDDVKQFYNSYLFLELEGFLDGQHIFLDPVTDETDYPPFPSDVPPTEQYSLLMIIGLYGSMDISLCVDLVTGKVYAWDMEEDWEGTYKEPELIADSLTDMLAQMTPVRPEKK